MRLRVRFAETDQMRIAHHSSYVIWLEASRVEWLRDRGLYYRQLEDEGISLAVSGLQLEYRAAARFDDELEVTARLVEARSRRLGFDYRVMRVADDVLLARGSSVHVPTDPSGRAISLKGEWLARLQELLEE